MAFSAWPSLRPLAAAATANSKRGCTRRRNLLGLCAIKFELTPEFTNLVSVVRGHFTKVNREIAFNEATRLNLRSAPGSELSAGNSKEGRPELVARIEFLEWTEFPLA